MSLVGFAQLGTYIQSAVQCRKIVFAYIRDGLCDAFESSFVLLRVVLGLSPAVDIRADEVQEPDRLGGVNGPGFERVGLPVYGKADA